jgi:ABC-type transporter Mla subunit MlaD
VVAIAALLLAAGCGSDSSETAATDNWASSLCTAALDWRNAITSSVDSLRGGNLNEESLRTAGDDVKTSTETFVDDVKGLGKPDTESGQKAKASVDDLSTQIDDDMKTIQDAVSSTKGASGLISTVTTITTTLQTASKQVSDTLDELQSLDAKGELESAIEGASSCKELSS